MNVYEVVIKVKRLDLEGANPKGLDEMCRMKISAKSRIEAVERVIELLKELDE